MVKNDVAESQQSSTTTRPRGGRAFYRTMTDTGTQASNPPSQETQTTMIGMGIHVDVQSGKTVYNVFYLPKLYSYIV